MVEAKCNDRRKEERKENTQACLISVFDGGLFQALGANSAEERDSWLQALQLASYECMRSQLLALQQRIEALSGHKHDTDIHMLRLQRGILTGSFTLSNHFLRHFEPSKDNRWLFQILLKYRYARYR